MKNTIKTILGLLFFTTLLNSCLVDDDIDLRLDQSPLVIGFKQAVAAESFFEDIGPVQKSYPVDVLGGEDGTLLEESLTINFEIDPSSTATEGQEFNFVDNSGTLTIPAGGDFVGFPLEILTGGLDPDAPTVLILKLTSSTGNSVISSLNDTLEITFVGCQSTVNEFQYQVTTIRQSDNAVVKAGVESISELDVNFFKTESTGEFGPDSSFGPIAAENGFEFVDICGVITVNSQNLVGAFSNQVSGSGEVDPETGDITFNISIAPLFDADSVSYISTYEKL